MRHIAAVGLFAALMGVFTIGRGDLNPYHFWNRAAADAAFVLLCLILMIGPAARLYAPARKLVPWRRELGIMFVVGVLLHILIYIQVYRWDIFQLFAHRAPGHLVPLRDAFAAANWIGLVALLYAIMLGITSNDATQRWLGKGWKLLQQQSYTLFVLTGIHIGLIIYLVYEAEGRTGPFAAFWVVLVALTVGLQVAGFIRTVHQQNKRRFRKDT